MWALAGLLAAVAATGLRAGERALPPPMRPADLEAPVRVGPDSQVLAATARVDDLWGVGNPAAAITDFLQPGEKLEYQAHLGLLPAGTIQFAIRRSLQPRAATVRANLVVEPNDYLKKSLERIFNFRTELNSVIDARTGRSLVFNREEVVGNEVVLVERLRLAYDEKSETGEPRPSARFNEDKKDKKTGKLVNKERQPYPIPPAVQDALSAFYYARTLPLRQVGDQCRFLVAGKKCLDTVVLKTTGREVVDLGELGRYDCLVVVPEGDGDNAEIVRAKGTARVWLERNTRIVLKIQIEGFFGNITAQLSKIENNPALRQYRLVP